MGYGLGLATLGVLLMWPSKGSDPHAYYAAARHLAAWEPLYQLTNAVGPGACFYPPLFAELWAPPSVLPEPLFVWLWRLANIAALRYLAGPWRVMGWSLLLPLTLLELGDANASLPVAAMSLAALRGRAGLAVWAGAWKWGPFVLLPFLWLHGNRRSLAWGALTVTLACLVSAALSPGAWGEYARAMLFYAAGSTAVDPDLIRILPRSARTSPCASGSPRWSASPPATGHGSPTRPRPWPPRRSGQAGSWASSG